MTRERLLSDIRHCGICADCLIVLLILFFVEYWPTLLGLA